MNQISFDLSSPEMQEAFSVVAPGDEVECEVTAVVTKVGKELVADVTSVEYDGYEYEFGGESQPEEPMMEPAGEPKPRGGGLVVVVGTQGKPKSNGK